MKDRCQSADDSIPDAGGFQCLKVRIDNRTSPNPNIIFIYMSNLIIPVELISLRKTPGFG